jgi:hypothetical protein
MSTSDNDGCTCTNHRHEQLIIRHTDESISEIELNDNAMTLRRTPNSLVIWHDDGATTFFPLINVRSYTVVPPVSFEKMVAEMIETARPDLDT